MAPLFRRFEEATQAINRGGARDAISVLEQLVRDDPSNAVFRSTLGRGFREAGDAKRAISFYRQSVAMKEKHLGPAHPSLGTTPHNMALLARAQGDEAEAAALSARARSILEPALGDGHPHVAACRTEGPV